MSRRGRAVLQGVAIGAALFLVLLAILLLSGDLSGSKFLYVDF